MRVKLLFSLILLLLMSSELYALDDNIMDAKNYKPKATIIMVETKALSGIAVSLSVNKITSYKNLDINLLSCWRSPTDSQESAAFVRIEELETDNNINKNSTSDSDCTPKRKLIYYGWLLNKHKYLSPIQHPLYDFWLKSCHN